MSRDKSHTFISLRNKVLSVALLLPLLSTCLTILLISGLFRQQILASVLQAVVGQTQNLSQLIEGQIDLVSADVLSLSRTPLIEGMVETRDAGGSLYLNGSTYEDWKQRLQATFVAEVESKNHYYQLRYIDETGQEIVQVNNRNGQAEVVNEENLQNKADRAYFQEASRRSRGSIYASAIELNREGTPAMVELPYVPVMRFAAGVFNDAGNFRGLVIANILAEKIFDPEAIENNLVLGDYLVVDKQGNYLWHPDNSKAWSGPSDLNTSANLAVDYPEFFQAIIQTENQLLQINNEILITEPIVLDGESNSSVVFIRRVSRTAGLEFLNATMGIVATISALTIGSSTLLLWYFITKLIRPIRQLTQAVENVDARDQIKKVIVDTDDEIGILARAFNVLSDKLTDIYLSMEQKVEEQTAEIQKRSIETAIERDRLALATEAGGVGVWDWDVTTNTLMWDEQMYRLFGAKPEDFKSDYEAFAKCLEPASAVETQAKVDKALEGTEDFDTEFIIIRPSDGQRRIIRAIAKVYRDTNGLAIRMIGVNWDITDQKEAETKLEQSEEMFRSVFDHTSIGTALVTETGKFIQVNQALAQMLGYSREELQEMTFFDVTYAADVHKGRKAVEQLFGREKDHIKFEKRYVHKNGQIIWAYLNASVVTNSKDKTRYLVSQVQDVTQQKEYESQLQQFKQAVEASTDGIIFTDPEAHIVYVNEAWERMTEYQADEVLGKNPSLLQSGQTPKEVYQKMWTSLLAGKSFVTDKLINKTKSGKIYHAQVSISPIFDKNNQVKFFIGIEQNIDERVAVDRMKTEFVSLASHQLRTPLTGMKWNVEMLMDGDVGELSPSQMKVVDQMYRSTQRLVRLINDLLDVSRIESGRLILEPKLTDLKQLIDDVREELSPLLVQKHQQCICSVHEALPKLILDPKLIRNVFINLISNAIKYTQDEGLIEIFVSHKDDQMLVQVSDNGLGIPAEEQHRVFEKFYRGANVTKTDTEGTGLGMYLVKAIIEQSGGKIWFESEVNKGTTFWFTLPVNNNSGAV